MAIKSYFKILAIAGMAFLFSCTASKPTANTTMQPPVQPETPQMITSTDSLSYAIGVFIASYYKNQGVDSVNGSLVKQAFADVYKNDDSALAMNLEEANMTIQEKLQAFMNAKIEKQKEMSKHFLDSVAQLPGVVKLPSGLMYEVLEKGNGPVPKATDTIKADYIGMLTNGEEFDNSYKRGQPLELTPGGVIKGWSEALQLMPVGSKWKVYIPSNLGYGDRGAGAAIPGGAALVFTIHLLEIVNH